MISSGEANSYLNGIIELTVPIRSWSWYWGTKKNPSNNTSYVLRYRWIMVKTWVNWPYWGVVINPLWFIYIYILYIYTRIYTVYYNNIFMNTIIVFIIIITTIMTLLLLSSYDYCCWPPPGGGPGYYRGDRGDRGHDRRQRFDRHMGSVKVEESGGRWGIMTMSFCLEESGGIWRNLEELEWWDCENGWNLWNMTKDD